MLRESAPIIDKHTQGEYVRLVLESPQIAAAAAPGQFLMVRVEDGFQPLLRRPFGIHDVSGTRLEIFFQVVGVGTALLSRKSPGITLDLLGPLGRGFTIDPAGKQQAALIGGGRGIAPLFFLGRILQAAGIKVRVFCGGRSAGDLVMAERFQAAGFPLVLSTDDGTRGVHGTVTEAFLDDSTPRADILYACGPDPMLKAVSEISRRLRVPAELSLESIMGCGFGACWGCVQRIRRDGEEGWRKICQEGPVFRADDVVWKDNGDA